MPDRAGRVIQSLNADTFSRGTIRAWNWQHRRCGIPQPMGSALGLRAARCVEDAVSPARAGLDPVRACGDGSHRESSAALSALTVFGMFEPTWSQDFILG